ncbi:MAG: aspartate 1-decarboxylase [Catalinimonas sp.]
MYIELMKSKIHRARVTQAELHYVGSITLDEELMRAAELVENQKVQIVNVDNGERLETYVIRGEPGSGTVCLNGPAARRVQVGDTIIVIAYAYLEPGEVPNHRPVVVFPDEHNRLN